MLIFAVPFNSKSINQAFIKAFENMQCIFARLGVELIIIDCGVADKMHLEKKVSEIANYIDGIIFPGNPNLIDPKLYGETPLHPERIDPEENNFAFVKHLINQATEYKIPILGICAGAWYINVARGGSLIQEMTPFNEPHVNHDTDPRNGRVVHEIEILPDTQLSTILNLTHTRVNSWHDQSLGKLGHGLRACAIAPDGSIEAIEDVDTFCLGIQFHPEYLRKGDDSSDYLPPAEIAKQHRIFSEMVAAAKERYSKMKQKTFLWTNTIDPRSKARFLVYHQSNTDYLITRFSAHGKLQIR